jgi:hypothetical protein
LANALVRFKPATTNKIKLAPKIQLKIHLLSYFVRVILLFKQARRRTLFIGIYGMPNKLLK